MLSLLLTIAGNAVYAQTPPPADTEAESGARSAEPRPEDGPAGLRYGDYRYDPSGNIAAIGQNYYTYDTLGRVKAAGVQYDGFVQTRTYTYDVYGNRTSDGPNSFPANAQNNRYTGAAYDPAGTGNMTSWQPPGANGTRQYNYDALDQITRETADLPGTSNDPWAVHIYTADEERLWTFHSTGQSSWTIRDLNGSVLREYRTDGVSWSVHRDYVYRSGQLLAARTPAGTHHYSLDHLGTPRVVTDDAGVVIGEHAYWPFGSELTGGAQPREGALRFTGHERDADLADVSSDGLDYMHARSYSANLGRFISTDPIDGYPGNPQSWNKYTYGLNNPVSFTDPTGLSPCPVVGSDGISRIGECIDVEAADPLREAHEAAERDSALREAELVRQMEEANSERGPRGYSPMMRAWNSSSFGDTWQRFGEFITPQSEIELGIMLLPWGRGALKLFGRNATVTASRILTDLPGGRAAAKSIFRNLTRGARVLEQPLKNGGVRRFTPDGRVQIRHNPNGATRIDIKHPNGQIETIHFK